MRLNKTFYIATNFAAEWIFSSSYMHPFNVQFKGLFAVQSLETIVVLKK